MRRVKTAKTVKRIDTAHSTVLTTGQDLKIGTREESDVSVHMRGPDSGKLSKRLN